MIEFRRLMRGNMSAIKITTAMASLSILLVGCTDDSDSEAAAGSMIVETEITTGLSPDENVSVSSANDYANVVGKAESGESAFQACLQCHATKAGVNRVGPSLAGIVGRKAGTVAGYNYSAANANIDIVWTEENLFDFLANPNRVIDGTKMIFSGLLDIQERADIIAYMKSLD